MKTVQQILNYNKECRELHETFCLIDDKFNQAKSNPGTIKRIVPGWYVIFIKDEFGEYGFLEISRNDDTPTKTPWYTKFNDEYTTQNYKTLSGVKKHWSV